MDRDKRPSVMPIPLLESEVGKLESDVRKMIRIDLEEIKESPDQIRKFSHELKELFKKYCDLNRQLVQRLIDQSPSKSNEQRLVRHALHADIIEILRISNGYLQTLDVELESSISSISISHTQSETLQSVRSDTTVDAKNSSLLPASHSDSNIVTPHSESSKFTLGDLSCEQTSSRVASYILEQNQPDNNVNVSHATDHIAENPSKSPETSSCTRKHVHFADDNPFSFASKITSPQSVLQPLDLNQTMNTSSIPNSVSFSSTPSSVTPITLRNQHDAGSQTRVYSVSSYFSPNDEARESFASDTYHTTARPAGYVLPSLTEHYPPEQSPFDYHQDSSPTTHLPPYLLGSNRVPSRIATSLTPNTMVGSPVLPTSSFNVRNSMLQTPNSTVGSSAPPLPNYSNNQQHFLEASQLFIIKQELFKPSCSAFSGEPHRYHAWVNTITHRTSGLKIAPWEMLTILHANTAGKAQKLIETHMDIGGADPSQTLSNVWTALYEQFGSGTRIAQSLLTKLNGFPVLRSMNDMDKVRELISLCQLILCNISVSQELETFNLAQGTCMVWNKLPTFLKNAWRKFVSEHKMENRNSHPPFQLFVDFLVTRSREYNEPSYVDHYSRTTEEKGIRGTKPMKALLTDAEPTWLRKDSDPKKRSINSPSAGDSSRTDTCPIHESSKHDLSDCRAFEKLPFQEKKSLLLKNGRCFRCFGKHLQSVCTTEVVCSTCHQNHHTIMHKPSHNFRNNPSTKSKPNETDSPGNSNLCTEVCGYQANKTCSKVILVDLTIPAKSNRSLRCYCIVDEQSSSSFIDPRAVEFFGLDFPQQEYTLTTLSGLKSSVTGMVVSGVKVRGVTEKHSIALPDMFTNNFIPDCRQEVASPQIVRAHGHVARFAKNFPKIDFNAEVSLLIGRDCSQAMKTQCFGYKPPFVHHTAVGWALVGSVCKGSASDNNVVLKTNITREHFLSTTRFLNKEELTLSPVFNERSDDELLGESKEDQHFLSIVSEGIHINEKGHITMPLPFRENSAPLPDNRAVVFNRSINTLSKLKRDERKSGQVVKAMQKTLDSGFVEPIPPEEIIPSDTKRCWYIPVFPVFQPKKNKVRLVYDSSATFKNISLNSQLLQGPDWNNRLRSVLPRFRNGEVGFGADIQSMFYVFHLPDEDKDFTRFFWWKNNDPKEDLVEYRANVHIFGNTSSPSLATLGLRFAVMHSECSQEVKDFVFHNFYVDDACGATNSAEQATSLLKDTIEALGKYNIKLHKICSNSNKLVNSFPSSERADSSSKDMTNSNLQHILGIEWDTTEDRLIIRTSVPDRPFTKRGVLATLNSTFDPLDFIAPLILSGRILQRLLVPSKNDNPSIAALGWDDPLPDNYYQQWEDWKTSIRAADGKITIPRCLFPPGFSPVIKQELHAFSDASIHGIGHVVYVRSFNSRNEPHVSFLFASSKIAPRCPNSIPRLELCAAVDMSIATLSFSQNLQIETENVFLYCDSKIVLGYISNTTKRFSRYVTRRVNLITKSFPVSHWHYVDTAHNPADVASRPQTLESLTASSWFKGPSFLWTGQSSEVDWSTFQALDLPEESPPITLCLHSRTISGFFSAICNRCSTLSKALNVLKNVLFFIQKCSKRPTTELNLDYCTQVAIKLSQTESFHDLQAPISKSNVLRDKNLLKFSPFLDDSNIIRVGGRLSKSSLPYEVKHPVLISDKHPLAKLIISHFHKLSKHQGRHLTSGLIRSNGYFIQHSSKMVRKHISSCVTCKKLRDLPLQQKMADLPSDRLHESPPFTYTGLDVFGPIIVTEGKTTRKFSSEIKVWGLLFTCLVSRAVHIEPLPGLDTVTFKNALRRFFSIRGVCRLLRSDRGTNFVGAYNEGECNISIEDIKNEVNSHNQCEWILNPPKASHFGGVWERKIGSFKRIFEASLSTMGPKKLNRDDLYTLFQEASAIINNTPMWEVSSDPNEPFPLTPAMLLTLKDQGNPPPLDSFTEKDIQAYGRRRYRRVQYLADQFWSRWRQEYLHSLQPRPKWTQIHRSLTPGDIVIMKDRNLKRNNWPMARVSDVKLSSDGLVRSVILSVPSRNGNPSILTRPVSDIVFLLKDNE